MVKEENVNELPTNKGAVPCRSPFKRLLGDARRRRRKLFVFAHACREEKKIPGFSLIEVTLALGIVAVAMIPLIGLLPVGLSASHDATEKVAFSHIVKRISADLRKLPFGQIDGYLSEARYFTYQGTSASEGEAIFMVVLAASGPSYPGSGALAGLNTELQRVEIEITRPGQTKPLYKTTLTIANNGL